MPRLVIYGVDWDERNIGHATLRATTAEIEQVFLNDPIIRRNKRGRSADYIASGLTNGGRDLTVAFVYDQSRHAARPITAWEG